MRCDEFSTRFDELLDKRREPMDEPDMAAHVAGCVDCRRTAASIGAAIGALAELRVPACSAAPDASSALSLERVLAAIRRDEAEALAAPADLHSTAPDSTSISSGPFATTPFSGKPLSSTASRLPASSFWRGSAFYALIATAATVVLAAYPVWRWNASPAAMDPNVAQIAVAGPSGTAGPQTPDVAVEQEPLASFTELAQESRDSYEQLARDTRRSFGDALALADVFSSEAPAYEVRGEATDGWLNQVENGLEPLKRSTLGTLDVLRQVVPADTESRS